MRKHAAKAAAGLLTVIFALAAMLSACHEVDDDRIPNMPVNIQLTPDALWHKYGVSGFGNYRRFIISLREPADFFYTSRSATGFGGVLLIEGADPFSGDVRALAFDLSCPVERKPDIRVDVINDGMEPVARCPKCGSKYRLVEGGGTPIDGPAQKEHWGLKRYEVLDAPAGGKVIVNN